MAESTLGEKIIREYYLKKVSKEELITRYNVSRNQIYLIIRKFAAENEKSTLLMKNKPTNNAAEELKALQEEVLSLKKQLYDEQMRADFFEMRIDVVESTFNIEIRK